MFLVDTNIFLEILLRHDKKEECKQFLDDHINDINITDFSLHSIGVILFRYGKKEVFHRFVEDVMPNANFLSLPITMYGEIVKTSKNLNLDFDDTYQYSTAKQYGLKVVTMDKDFEKAKDVEVVFI